jgi:hypothetical protein
MQRNDAVQLVQRVFQSAFDAQQYAGFVRELTNGNITPPKTGYMAVPDAYTDHVKSCTRIGTYENDRGELVDILIVHVQSSFKIDRARTALRNFVAHKLKRGEGSENNYKEAALVAFVAPNAAEWRFSFVRMEYATVRDAQTGKYKTEEQLTPARRFTYLVGPAEQTHTAQSRFIDLLVARGKPTVDDIMAAFSVEKVTSEFFEAYKKLFLQTLDELNRLCTNDAALAAEFARAEIDRADFSKKMLGQIVFLYFLQKKGWLGVAKGAAWGTGPANYMRSLAQRVDADGTSLFNDILEPLFYDTLAIDRKADNDWAPQLGCRIPFLNGGLFEPYHGYDWRNTEITFADALFTNPQQTGILDVFDRYNFTVDEAEPLETDVAIDPEMLGKVFENLLDVNDRAATGAFYTPREIVHYMCQVSLVHYLERAMTTAGHPVSTADVEALVYRGDQAAEYEKARESGTSSYTAYLPESIRKNAKALDTALEQITVLDPAIGSGAFPVGMMNEIVRLRSVLSAYFSDHRDRTIYDFKRHAIQNSLYGVDLAAGAVEIAKLRLWLSLVVDEDDESRIKPLPNLDFKIVVGNSLLASQRDVFTYQDMDALAALKKRFFDETDHDAKEQLRENIEMILKNLGTDARTFDYAKQFGEVYSKKDGFDIVIGNPPYVQLQKFRGDPIQAAYKSVGYESYDANGDLYCLFYEQGIRQLRTGGTLCYITSNKWMRAGYGEKLRRYFLTHNPLLLIDLGPGVFESATVDSNILFIEKNVYARELFGLTVQDKTVIRRGLSTVVAQHLTSLPDLKNDGWFIGNASELSLKEKIARSGKQLKDWHVSMYRGVLTGLNEAFIIDNATRDLIVSSDPKSAEIIKPILRGRDIERYGHTWAGFWIINTEYDIDVPKKYPAVFNHLQNHEIKGKKRGDKGKNWWNLRTCVYYHEFDNEKITWQRITQEPRFCFAPAGLYILDSMAFFTTDTHAKYLCAVLNSKVIYYFVSKVVHQYGKTGFRLSNQYVEIMPIPPITPANQPLVTAIEAHVERILAAKQQDINADTRTDEAAIDQLVYQLYDLTPDEIAIIQAAQPVGVGTAAPEDEE